MALIARFSRLLKADMHAVLDLVEEPEQVIAQSIRDMQDSIQRASIEARTLEARRQELERRLVRLDDWLNGLGKELDVCFGQAEGDELARGVLRKKLAAERLRTQLHQDREDLAADLDERRERLRRHRTELAELRQKAELFTPSATGSVCPISATDLGHAPAAVSDEDVEIALIRERAARSGS